MKKILVNLIIFIIISFISLILILSTIGIETNKFNKLVTERTFQDKNISLKLDTIKFKINPKEFSLFLETQNPEIEYRDLLLPVNNIKVYVDFLSFFRADPIIKKINLMSGELSITQISKLSTIIKPSTFKSLLNNKIKEGKLISEIEIFLKDDGSIKDLIVKGTIRNLKVELFNNINLKKTNLSFFADKNDILIKNIFGFLDEIKISDGDIRLNLENGIKLNSNFNSKIDLNDQVTKKYIDFFKKYDVIKGLRTIKADLNNNFSIEFDNTYKVKDYNYSINGKLQKIKFELLSPIKNNFIFEEIKNIYFSDLRMKTSFKPNAIKISGDGKYSFDESNFLDINLENNFNNEILNLKLDFDYIKNIQLDLINYKKPENSVANIFLVLKKKKNDIIINELNFKEENNSIKIQDLNFNNNTLLSFKKIEVKTANNFKIFNFKF